MYSGFMNHAVPLWVSYVNKRSTNVSHLVNTQNAITCTFILEFWGGKSMNWHFKFYSHKLPCLNCRYSGELFYQYTKFLLPFDIY